LYVLLVQEYVFVVELVLQHQIVKNRKSFLSVNGTGVNYGSLEAGMKYLLAVLDMSGVGSKLVQDLSIYWWILLLTFLLAFLLSLVWIGEHSCDSCFWSG
jgi:ABC-type phosphate/phosphonate transport system permease subunit